MIFNVRYIDTFDWIQGEDSHWSPVIPLDLAQYVVEKQKINDIYSVVGGGFYKVENSTATINKSLYLRFRKLMEHYWNVWGYTSQTPSVYAEEIANKIKDKLESDSWNPWGEIPQKLNLVIVRRTFKGEVVWINNAFYIGEDPEATETIVL